jgi:hypothetical protein
MIIDVKNMKKKTVECLHIQYHNKEVQKRVSTKVPHFNIPSIAVYYSDPFVHNKSVLPEAYRPATKF